MTYSYKAPGEGSSESVHHKQLKITNRNFDFVLNMIRGLQCVVKGIDFFSQYIMGGLNYIHMLTSPASNKNYLDKELLIVSIPQRSKLHTTDADLFNPIGF